MAKSKSIYASVLPNLKPLPPSDQSYQDRVEREKDAIRLEDDQTSVTLAAQYALQRVLKEAKEAELSKINLRIAALEQMLTASQDAREAGWGEYGVAENALRLPSGDTIRVQREPYGKVMDKEALRLWCIANGYENQLQLWPSTMNALVKERLLVGEPEPDGVEAFSQTKVVFTVAKGE